MNHVTEQRRLAALLVALACGASPLGCSGPSQDGSLDGSALEGSTVPGPDGSIASRACPGASDPGPGGRTFDSLRRYGDAGDTEVDVVFCNPLIADAPGELRFFAILQNHFGVPSSDLTQTWAETGAGRTESPFTWDGADLTLEDHHVSGHLAGPLSTADGLDLLGPGAAFLALHLGRIGSTEEMILRWEADALP